MTPIIIAGGVGTRLWPLSRALFPKQYLSLLSSQTMLQDTVCRLRGLEPLEQPLVVCSEEHRFIVAEQLRGIQVSATVLLEPLGRNTAPAIASAANQLIKSGNDPLMLVLPADHAIEDVNAFHEAVGLATPLAAAGKLVTFGITPLRAETGYGYIKLGNAIKNQRAWTVDSFAEKPNFSLAQEYVASGDYLWNSGMFLFRASSYLAELKKHAPEIFHATYNAVTEATIDLDFIRLDRSAYDICPENSIDYAVMEHTDKGAVVALDAGWSDVGSWHAMWSIGKRDTDGNVCRGDVIAFNTRNSYLHSDCRLISVVGLDDIVVVETSDAVLVAHRDHVQDVKQVVAHLNKKGRSEATSHRHVYRPWGEYDSVDNGDRYQVKRITVKPGGRLSVQMHHHRAEHWIVVSGTAKIHVDGRDLLLTENQSTYIPVGAVHSLENPGKIPLEVIEVQSGAYLGEDDIVRLDDRYGRS